ncbi:MAG: phosphate acyltransferase PlsX [Phycisphaerales bacterium]|nr:phosphate acyltransferase PlsX [Phycisphaerales bacterium]
MGIRIGVDVLGGDHGPEVILQGCIDGLQFLSPNDALVLIGPADLIASFLKSKDISDERLVIEHAAQGIPMDAAPTVAVRSMPDSTIVRMAQLGSHKADIRCDAVISAGNTGACVAGGQMYMKRLPGVHRPGIAVAFPSFHGPVVLCDAGANPEPRANHLWQYGVMADIYAKRVFHIEKPRVGLMNIGSEESKGSALAKETAEMLRRTPGLNYIGFIEGRDLFAGTADVVITDGFVGNTTLKMAEGFAKSIFQAIVHEISQADPQLAMQFQPIIKSIYKKNDYHEHGGAPLLGVNGVMMIAHGTSEARTIRAAIRNTLEYVRGHVNDQIVERLEELSCIEQGEPA